jgi:iron complex transport system substrate-binding protein
MTKMKKIPAAKLIALSATSALIGLSITNFAAEPVAATNLRIISLSPTATEDLYAIGAGSSVIAVSSDSNYPASAPVTALDAYNPNVEAIVKYQPNIVILNSGATKAEAVKTALQKLHIKVYFESAPNDMSGVYSQIHDLGLLTGTGAKANNLVRQMKKAIAAAIAQYKRKTPISFFHELDNTLYSATSDTFIGKVYADFNLSNIADAAAKADSYGYPQLTPEYLLKANPAAIFLSDAQYGESLTTVAARPGWSTISAVINHHVISLPDDIPSRWGPRMVDFYQFVGKAISLISSQNK